ncbi:hypothetical protein ACIBI3_27745 [Actinomadura luteofluorescens]|uniref:hypothetical protein n=1 Tax=Actinomadura luteofluorescens TaxID=46163 RepID=UPI00347A28CB
MYVLEEFLCLPAVVAVFVQSQAGIVLNPVERDRISRRRSGDRLGRPSRIFVRGRGFERPYISPPTVQIIRQGAPLAVSMLDPSRTFLWLIDAQGDIRIAPEQDPSYASLYPRRVYLEGSGRPDHGLKHADLAAGASYDRVTRLLRLRPPARIGGELRPETAHDGLLTGRWILNNDSAYNARKTRLDFKSMGQKELRIAFELLRATGTDTSDITVHAFRPD